MAIGRSFWLLRWHDPHPLLLHLCKERIHCPWRLILHLLTLAVLKSLAYGPPLCWGRRATWFVPSVSPTAHRHSSSLVCSLLCDLELICIKI
eukprot:UN00910